MNHSSEPGRKTATRVRKERPCWIVNPANWVELPSEAPTNEYTVASSGKVFTRKVAVVAPWVTTTLFGTKISVGARVKTETVTPPVGAAALKVIVAFAVWPPAMLFELRVSEVIVWALAARQTRIAVSARILRSA